MLAWLDEAVCRGEKLSKFFGEELRRTKGSTAKAVCAKCPVQAECLAYAKRANIYTGVIGNTTPKERGNSTNQRKALNNG